MKALALAAAAVISSLALCACDERGYSSKRERDSSSVSTFDASAPQNIPEPAKFAKPGPAKADAVPVPTPLLAQSIPAPRLEPQAPSKVQTQEPPQPEARLISLEFNGAAYRPGSGIGDPTLSWQDAPPPADQLGAITFDDGTRKPLTPDDLLWAARAIHGETAGSATEHEAAAMLWTLAQRMRWSPTFRHWTLAKLAQNFSQPINAGWLAGGSFCKDKTTEACSEHRTKLRAHYRALPWQKISAPVRRVVVAFAQGKVDNAFVGSIDWLDSGMWLHSGADQRHRPGTAAACSPDANDFSRLTIRGNSFLAVRCPGNALDSWSWRGGEVAVVGADGNRSKIFRSLPAAPTLVASAN